MYSEKRKNRIRENINENRRCRPEQVINQNTGMLHPVSPAGNLTQEADLAVSASKESHAHRHPANVPCLG